MDAAICGELTIIPGGLPSDFVGIITKAYEVYCMIMRCAVSRGRPILRLKQEAERGGGMWGISLCAVLVLSIAGSLALAAPQAMANGVSAVVTRFDDTNATASGVVGNGTGVEGDLRSAMRLVGGGGTIIFECANSYRAFFADRGYINLSNLTIRNVLAKGGNGGDSTSLYPQGGGGGAGFGAGLFVNDAVVTVTNVIFINAVAQGGGGGSSTIGSLRIVFSAADRATASLPAGRTAALARWRF